MQSNRQTYSFVYFNVLSKQEAEDSGPNGSRHCLNLTCFCCHSAVVQLYRVSKGVISCCYVVICCILFMGHEHVLSYLSPVFWIIVPIMSKYILCVFLYSICKLTLSA